jgi:phenylalanyl-tRNA synthetase beta chain
MSESYSVLRDSLLPSLLKVEAASSKAFYPHRIFEVGEVVIKEADHGDPKTEIHLGALLAHPTANFSEAHAYLEMLFYYLDLPYRLEATPHPSYLEGRVGRIFVREEKAGLLGEIHPEVLERWSIGMPCSVFEISLDTIFRHHPGMGSGVESDSPC